MTLETRLREASASAREAATGNAPRAASTIRDYIKKIKAMRKEYAAIPSTVELDTDFGWIGDTDKFTGWLRQRYPNPRTYASQVNAMTAVLRWLPAYSDMYQAFSQLNKEAREAKEQLVLDNRLTPKEQDVLKPWRFIAEKLQRRLMHHFVKGQERLMLSFMRYMAPRRIEDWRLLKYTEDEADAMRDTDANHLWRSRDGWAVTFHKYKTSRTLGTQTFKVPFEAFIEDQLARMNMRKGQYVFHASTSPDSTRETSNFSTWVSSVLAEAGLPGLSMNSLRHSYITDHIHSAPSLREKRKVANEMATSVFEMDRYYRIGLQ